jgi:hypothetical protein
MRRYRSPSGSIDVTGISGFSIVLGCADVDFVSGVAFVSPMVEVNLAFSRDMSTIRDGSSQCKQERKDKYYAGASCASWVVGLRADLIPSTLLLVR